MVNMLPIGQSLGGLRELQGAGRKCSCAEGAGTSGRSVASLFGGAPSQGRLAKRSRYAVMAVQQPATLAPPRQQNNAVPVLGANLASLRWKEQLTVPEKNELWHRDVGLPSEGWRREPSHLTVQELWETVRQEAKIDADEEPALASFMHTSVLVHSSLEKAMAFVLANKLSSRTLLGTQLMRLISDAYADDKSLIEACAADIQAVFERDAACDKYLQCLLYFKGFQAVQSHRIAHWLWQQGRRTLAIALQSRVSEVLQVDIHPAARIGWGIMIDHATGVVIGETAVVGDNVSMLHHVTLGGSGTGKGMRHPVIGHGVLLGAGTCVLGPITVGAGSKVGAGSVVVSDLPCHCVAVGVPARIIKQNCTHEPCREMDLVEDFVFDYEI